MMMNREKECQGECPYCGSDSIDYQTSEMGDSFVMYPTTCEDCGKEFDEYYDLTYSSTVYYKEDEG